MASLADTIALLSNPTPTIQDPEDDVNIETAAKVEAFDEDADILSYEISDLRCRNAPVLENIDPRYAGRKVSKKSLESVFKDDEITSIEDSTHDTFHNQSSDVESSDEDDVSEEEFDDGDLESFKKRFESQEISNESCEGDDSKKEESESELEDELEEDNEDSGTSDEIENDDSMVYQFSNIDVTSEIEKGNAINSQQDLWNKLCECRIKLQKLLILANKMPQSSIWKNLKDKGGKELSENLYKAHNKVKHLLNNWLDLQEELLQRNPETSKLADGKNDKAEDEKYFDEEVLSDSDDEMEQSQAVGESKTIGIKRKSRDNECCKILAKRHKSLIPYRNSVIQKWDEKTHLSTGRMTQKSFMAFDNSALKQIEQILQDKIRLIKRTQLKRSIYRVLGKPDTVEKNNGENAQYEELSKQDMLLKDYDPEIFDDDDFYRQMLKDVIESKSVGIDPAMLRKQMEIQKIRNKLKRKVDTKASKGRKLRYDVHPKLVNFMAPVPTSTISDEARDSLLKCIFGGRSSQADNEKSAS